MSSTTTLSTSSVAESELADETTPTSAPLSNGRVAWLLIATVVVALAAYYFVGVDEGMSSIFGKSMMVHEWVHDARHFLGFPCH